MRERGLNHQPDERLAVIQHVTEVGLLALDPDETLREVLERVRVGLRASGSTILLLNGEAASLVPRASVGVDEHRTDVNIPVGSGIVGRVAASKRPALVPEIAAADPFVVADATLQSRSMVAVPLNAAGVFIGVLYVMSRRRGAFDESDVLLLKLLADRVALAIERVRVAERERDVLKTLRISEQRARAVLETAADAILTIDRAGRIESINPAAERLFAYPSRELIGRNVGLLMPEPYRSESEGYLSRYERQDAAVSAVASLEMLGLRRDDTRFPMEVTVSDVGPEANLLTVLVRDIGERKALEAQLAHQATHDSLTGLGNRALLMERLQLALIRLSRHPGAVALLFLDLDRFKTINDTLGHDAGDDLIVLAAGLLTGAVRPEDMVARVGGDEFVVLCTDLAGRAAAEAIAERVSTALNVSLDLRGHDVFLSASIGLVVTETDQRPATELMRDADAAMYQAKQRGRGRYALLDEDARAHMDQRLRLSNELRHAVARDELRARYQPLIDLRTGRIVAVEALMRWQHPKRGQLSPDAFFGVAADIGTMLELDDWMLHHACRDTAEWARQLGRPVGLWVNLSGQSLADPTICQTITTALHLSGLDPALLTLEITEGALMADAAATVGTLSELRKIGLTLAIDDFGTGYSSLAYLQQFPVHTLKIDRSFVAQLDGQPREAQASAAIARTIVSLATSLELQIVAEGIETFGQLAAVATIGCHLGQGYFLGRPAPQEDILRAVPGGVDLPSTFHEV